MTWNGGMSGSSWCNHDDDVDYVRNEGFILAHLHFFPPRPLPFIVSAAIRALSHSITYSRSSFLNEEELSLRLPMNVSPAAVDLMTICHLTDATAERNKRITKMLMQVGIPNSKSNPPYSTTARFSFSRGPSLFLELTIWLRGLLESSREVTTYQCGISEQIVNLKRRTLWRWLLAVPIILPTSFCQWQWSLCPETSLLRSRYHLFFLSFSKPPRCILLVVILLVFKSEINKQITRVLPLALPISTLMSPPSQVLIYPPLYPK